MKTLNRLLALALAFVLLTLPALAEPAADDVLATVNGVPVTRAEYENILMELENSYGSYGYDVTSEPYASILKQMAMLTSVEFKLLDEKLISENQQLTDEEKADAAQDAREYWQSIIDGELAYYGVTAETSEEERAAILLQVLAMYEGAGYTEESYIEQAVRYASYDKMYEWIVRDVTVSEEEIRAHYEELVQADMVAYQNDVAGYETMLDNNEMYLMWGMTDYYVDLYYVPEGFRQVTHILLMGDEALQTAYAELLSDPAADPAALEAARAAVLADVKPTLDEISALLENGASFAELIPMYTEDPGMADAAAIEAGYLVHPDSTKWVTEFRDAAFTVDEVGAVTEPVVTAYGVHVLQYVADVPGGPVPYTDDMRALLGEEILVGRQEACYSETIQSWVDAAEIVYAEEVQALMSGL